MKKNITKNVIIYQSNSGSIELKSDSRRETMWANLNQIADLFGVQKPAISKHIKNIFETGELQEKATVSKMETVQIEGSRKIARNIEMYNLDVIIAVGYRINSVTGTKFRIWATKTLKDHITKGFTVNRKQLKKNHQEFLKTVESIQNLLPEHVTLDPKAILDLVKEFSGTWVSLDAYDKEELKVIGKTKKSIKLSGIELTSAINQLRSELIRKSEATELFAEERTRGSIEGIIGNVMQSFGGKDIYQTAEEKAAHLLYFMVKNHPFVDGNKRSGAFAFIWFLRKTKVKTFRNINSGALTALTLLIAESKPEKKEQMVALVTQMLK